MKLNWIVVKVVPKYLKNIKWHNVVPEDYKPMPSNRGCILTLNCFLIYAFDTVVLRFMQMLGRNVDIVRKILPILQMKTKRDVIVGGKVQEGRIKMGAAASVMVVTHRTVA